MWLNENSWVLVYHPKLVKEAEQVRVGWLFNQLEHHNDGKWLVEGLGGLQPLVSMDIKNISRKKIVSIGVKHCDHLIDLHQDSKFMSFETESPISLAEAVKNHAYIIRRKCAEDVTLHTELWELDQVVGSVSKFFENRIYYRIKGPAHLFVNTYLMDNK